MSSYLYQGWEEAFGHLVCLWKWSYCNKVLEAGGHPAATMYSLMLEGSGDDLSNLFWRQGLGVQLRLAVYLLYGPSRSQIPGPVASAF